MDSEKNILCVYASASIDSCTIEGVAWSSSEDTRLVALHCINEVFHACRWLNGKTDFPGIDCVN
jgi:hypothetical protein